MAQKWITKDALGRIAGPFDTAEIIQRIHQNLITEQDYVATYPEGKWISVTKEPEFFDEMLNSLTGQRRSKPNSKEERADHTQKVNTGKIPQKEDSIAPTEVAKGNDISTEESSRVVKNFEQSVSSIRPTIDVTKVQKSTSDLFSQKEVFEIQQLHKISFLERYNKVFSVLLIVLSLAGAALFLWPEEVDTITGDEFKLRAPQFDMNRIPKQLEVEKTKIAYTKIKLGTFSDFREAQNELVQVLESNSNNKEALALLCFTYFHLWDFTEKNSRERLVVSKVSKRAISVDRFGLQGKTCKFVDFMVRSQYQEAQKVVDDVLDSEEGASNVTFSYFNGYLKSSRKDLITAESYLMASIARSQGLSTKTVNNEFTVMWQALADVQSRLSKTNEAYRSTLRILMLNPGFVDAYLLKGVLEYRVFRKSKVAKSTLQKAFLVMENNKANKKKLSEGYLVLAEIALGEKNRSAALDYAVAAYNYNPGNSVAKNLAIELGGNKEVGRKKVLSQQLVIEGEQSLQETGCATAQAFFKEAFKLDPQNGYAALKTAQCLWELSFSVEAIKWVESAILADPKLIEAYVSAAKFYIERYDFDAAFKVLMKGRNKAPYSYEIYRGLAALELKRENPQIAAEYCKRALKIYDADTETLILMTKALLALNDYQQAFQYIVRASENDSRNVEVHTTYGKVLYKVQGIFAATEYLKNRINSFPLEPAYRVALAEVLFEDQRNDEAEAIARETLQFDVKSKQALMILGKILRERNKKDEALRYFLDANSVDPSDAEPLFEASQLYIDIGQFDEAIKQFKRILAINPRYPEIYYNMAKIYFAQNKMEDALREVKEEIRNYPDHFESYILAAEIYFLMAESKRGELGIANNKTITEENFNDLEDEKRIKYTQMISYNRLCAETYQKAIDIAPQPSKVYIDLSRCYRFAGELDMAQKMVEKAISIEQGNPDVWRENGLIFEQKGEFALAMEAYKKYLILSPNAADRNQIVSRMKDLETKVGK